MRYQRELLKQMLATMLKIRRFEEKIVELYPEQEMKCPVHLYIGQEAVATGVCLNLKEEDYIFSNHRSHGHYIARGGDLRLLMAEIYGKRTGCSKGKGGSMHIVDPKRHIFGTSSIVGAGISMACGAALAAKIRGEEKISVSFFGDGAVDTGTFHESLNFASLKKLSVVFICENNFYATHSHLLARQPQDNIYRRAEGYGMSGLRVDGNDVMKVYKEAKEAIEKARRREGPSLIECRTYRWMGHVTPSFDIHFGYRTQEELDWWMERCPIKRFKEFLLKKKIITPQEIEKLTDEIDEEIEEAVRFGKESPYPDESELLQDIWD